MITLAAPKHATQGGTKQQFRLHAIATRLIGVRVLSVGQSDSLPTPFRMSCGNVLALKCECVASA